tara:strand:+ start:2824 stop:3714 length:891 start_codon:yes stop_codon:yes gene_type:complete
VKKNQYLSSEIISKLDNLHIIAKKVVEGFIVGLHKSPYHGFSVEFSDHRSYGPGDEVRHIDWKLWGKTNRFFVKRYEEETNLKAHIMIDQSGSMKYSSHSINKLEYSKMLAASLSYMLIKNQDSVGLYMFGDAIKKIISPRSTQSHLNTLISQMEQMRTSTKTNISKSIHQCAEKIHKKGLVILISDLMDDPKDVLMGLKHFLYKGHEVIIFHVLDPQEIDFNFKERIRFKDFESSNEILTDPRQLKRTYQKKFNEFIDFYKRHCGQNKIDYVSIRTDESLENALSDYLLKRKKLN